MDTDVSLPVSAQRYHFYLQAFCADGVWRPGYVDDKSDLGERTARVTHRHPAPARKNCPKILAVPLESPVPDFFKNTHDAFFERVKIAVVGMRRVV